MLLGVVCGSSLRSDCLIGGTRACSATALCVLHTKGCTSSEPPHGHKWSHFLKLGIALLHYQKEIEAESNGYALPNSVSVEEQSSDS